MGAGYFRFQLWQRRLIGSLDLNTGGGPTIGGTLRWSRSYTYNDQFLAVDAYPYTPPIKRAPAILGLPPSGEARFSISGGDLGAGFTKSLRISEHSAVTVIDPSIDRLKLNIQPASGIITGKFNDPASGTRNLRGIIVNKEPATSAVFGMATNYFIGGSWSIETTNP
jgi:hypothetical protein